MHLRLVSVREEAASEIDYLKSVHEFKRLVHLDH